MFILHVGAPKTGTTSLQETLGQIAGSLAARGLGFVPTSDFQKGPIGQYLRQNEPLDQDVVAQMVETAAAAGQRTLISDEGCTGPLMNPTKKRWAEAPARAFLLDEVLGGRTEKVVLTVRRQDHFLASCYAHRVRHGRVDVDFETYWRKEARLDSMSWLEVIQALEGHFGRDKLVVLPFERMRKDYFGFVEDFLRLSAGVDLPEEARSLPKSQRNNSLSAAAIDEALRIRREYGRIGRPISAIKDAIKSAFPRRPIENGRFEPDLAPLTKVLAKQFAAENALIARDYLAVKDDGFLF